MDLLIAALIVGVVLAIFLAGDLSWLADAEDE